MDYNATTPLDREVLATIHRSLKFAWGNPSSVHRAGNMLKVKLTKNGIGSLLRSWFICDENYFVLVHYSGRSRIFAKGI